MYGIAAEGSNVAMQTSPSVEALMAWARDNLRRNGAIVLIVTVPEGKRVMTGKAGTGWARSPDAVWGGAPYDYEW